MMPQLLSFTIATFFSAIIYSHLYHYFGGKATQLIGYLTGCHILIVHLLMMMHN